MLKNLIVITFLSLSVIFVSCEGPQGEVGPAGAAGAAGPAGPAGPKGDSGVNGQDGVGALMFSTGAVPSYQGGYVLGKSNLTEEDSTLIANSAILLYVKANNRWWAVPGIVRWDPATTFTNYGFYTRYAASRLYITLQALSWSEQQATAPERQFQDIRAVILPATEFRLSSEKNWSNYEETLKTLGLKDSDARLVD
jgi:hypothetical protein